VKELMNGNQLDSLKIAYFLWEGKVDFKKSDAKSNPCKVYIIEVEFDEKPAVMTVQNCPDKALIKNVDFN